MIDYYVEPKSRKDLRVLANSVRHYYDEKFKRTGPKYLTKELFEKYKKYMKGRKWYD